MQDNKSLEEGLNRAGHVACGLLSGRSLSRSDSLIFHVFMEGHKSVQCRYSQGMAKEVCRREMGSYRVMCP